VLASRRHALWASTACLLGWSAQQPAWARVKSTAWGRPVVLTIHNDSAAALKVYWLNYDGGRPGPRLHHCHSWPPAANSATAPCPAAQATRSSSLPSTPVAAGPWTPSRCSLLHTHTHTRPPCTRPPLPPGRRPGHGSCSPLAPGRRPAQTHGWRVVDAGTGRAVRELVAGGSSLQAVHVSQADVLKALPSGGAAAAAAGAAAAGAGAQPGGGGGSPGLGPAAVSGAAFAGFDGLGAPAAAYSSAKVGSPPRPPPPSPAAPGARSSSCASRPRRPLARPSSERASRVPPPPPCPQLKEVRLGLAGGLLLLAAEGYPLPLGLPVGLLEAAAVAASAGAEARRPATAATWARTLQVRGAPPGPCAPPPP
jgi:hypothetical protein